MEVSLNKAFLLKRENMPVNQLSPGDVLAIVQFRVQQIVFKPL